MKNEGCKLSIHIPKFKLLTPSFPVGTECGALFKSAIAQFEHDLAKALGVPVALFGTENYSSFATSAPSTNLLPSDPGKLKLYLRRVEAKMRAVAETSMIERRLPAFLTTNRRKLAEHLWVADRVFQHNLAAVATLHGLRSRFSLSH